MYYALDLIVYLFVQLVCVDDILFLEILYFVYKNFAYLNLMIITNLYVFLF